MGERSKTRHWIYNVWRLLFIGISISQAEEDFVGLSGLVDGQKPY